MVKYVIYRTFPSYRYCFEKQCENLSSIISGGLDTLDGGGGVLSLSTYDTFLLSCFVTDWTIVYR